MVGTVNRNPKSPSNVGLLQLGLSKFPHMQQYAPGYSVVTAPQVKADPRTAWLETYPVGEDRNPDPGKWTSELYAQDQSPQVTQNLLAGDFLHRMGAVNQDTGQPYSPTYYALKQAFLGARDDNQKAIDQHAYDEENKIFYKDSPPPSITDWLQNSRGDEYLMGLLSPANQETAQDWSGFLNPQQKQIGGILQQYLQGKYKPGGR